MLAFHTAVKRVKLLGPHPGLLPTALVKVTNKFDQIVVCDRIKILVL